MDAAYRNSSEGEGLSEEARPCSVVITLFRSYHPLFRRCHPCSVVIPPCSEGEGLSEEELQQRDLTLPLARTLVVTLPEP